MELTKEFVNSCRKVAVLRNFLCQAIDQVDEKDKEIAELKETHKKEVDRLLMKIAGLEKLVDTADKLLKPKGGFTINDVKFCGVKLEGTKEQ